MAYGIRERAVLIALAALGGERSNAELKNVYKLDLERRFRERLNRDGLISSRKESRSYSHSLTERGWQHVESEMTADVPRRAGSAAGALFALLSGLKFAADRAGGLKVLLAGHTSQPLATPFSHTPLNLHQQIEQAYRRLAKRPQDWVLLRDLRLQLTVATKSEVDSALKRMFLDKEINLTLNDDQGSLTQADRDAAIRIGANDMHMLSMG
jgi:hypothetical protein